MTGFIAATTLPTDFSAEMNAVLTSNGQSPTTTLDSKRLSILRGHVRTRASDLEHPGSPLQNVVVSVVGHGELGSVLTRSDGAYDIVVNGGQSYVLQFSLANYLTVQRQAQARWLDWTTLPDVALIGADTPTQAELDGSEGWVAIHGSTASDTDGSRTARVLFQPGTTMSCSGVDCSSLGTSPYVHLTEFTVGDDGPSAMPGDLPPQSGYTYAFEAGFLNGTQPLDVNVTFSKPALFYLENFVAAPLDAGNNMNGVPSGSYDKSVGTWQPETSGKVYCIIDIQSGAARMSIDPACDAAHELVQTSGDYDSENPPITLGERQQLASIYSSANKLKVWRVPLPHFTSYDLNWGEGPPANAVPPPPNPPDSDQPNGHSPCEGGSIIECENQVLRESIPILGTPYTLNYRSETQRGYHPTIKVPISTVDPSNASTYLPSTLLRAEAEIQVAGQDVSLAIDDSTDPNWREKPATLSWSWDRTDAYGNPVQGSVHAHVEVRYVYGSVPFNGGGFLEYDPYNTSSVSFDGNRSTREFKFTRKYDLVLGAFDDKPLGLGGWTISAHQVYQPASATLFRGDGRKQDPNDSPEIVRSYFAGTGSTTIEDLAAAADGSIYVLQSGGSYNLVGRIEGASLAAKTSSSEVSTWADGDPIGDVRLDDPTVGRNIIAESSGSLLYSDLCRVMRIVPVSYDDLRVYLVAGDRHDSCATSFAADGATAAGTPVKATRGLTELPDGTVLFMEGDGSSTRVRRIKEDGTLETLIGGGATNIANCTVSSPCSPSSVSLPNDNPNYSMAARSDGAVLVSGSWENRIWELDPRVGVIYSVAGDGSSANVGNGTAGAVATLPQAQNYLGTVTAGNGVEIVGSSASFLSVIGSTLFFPSYGGDFTIREMATDGTISGFGGTRASSSPYFDGLFAAQTALRPKRLILGADQYYYTTADNAGSPNRVVRFRRGDDTALPSNDILVPSDDGSVVYEFDATGRHLYTHSKYSGALLLNLVTGCGGGSCYDGQGRLTGLPDVHGTTTITYSGDTTVTIQPPVGGATTLTLTGGYLTKLADPATNATNFQYDSASRLNQLTEPVSANVHNFYYSSTGLLLQDIAPGAGAGTRLTRTDDSASYSIDFTTAQSRTTTHKVDMTATTDAFTDFNNVSYTRREQRTQTNLASSYATVDTWFTDSTHVHNDPDGSSTTRTTTSATYAPDPRFGMTLPYVSMRTVTTGSHDGSGTKCQSGYKGLCEMMERDVTPPGKIGFDASITAVTDKRWGSVNGYDKTTYPDLTTWSKDGSADPACASSPCVVRLSSEQRKVVYGLNADDQIKQITLPNIDAISIAYGASGSSQGKVTNISQNCPGTGCRTYALNYDANGFVGSIDTPLISGGNHTFSFTNDADGRPTQEVFDPSGSLPWTANMHYDANGNRDWLRMPDDPNSSTYEHDFQYNGRNGLSLYAPPGGAADRSYAYDLDGLLSSSNPPTGNVVTTTRDSAGRVAQTGYLHPTSGTVAVTIGYDATTGQSCTSSAGGCTATNGSALATTVTTTDTYDGYLVTSEETAVPNAFDRTIHSVYNDSLQKTEEYLDAQGDFADATFQYDRDGELSTLSDTNGNVLSVYRNANGSVHCITVGDICELYNYDEYGSLAKQEAFNAGCDSTCTTSGTSVFKIAYTRNDPSGRVTAKDETYDGSNECTWSYGYAHDANNRPDRISSASESGTGSGCGSDTSFSACTGTSGQCYDADGNETSGMYGGSYDPQDRMTSDGTSTYGYDAMGNLLSKTTGANTTYTYYDPLGNLRRWANGTDTVDYDIDFRNRRVAKIKDGSFTEGYLYDGDRIVAHVGSNGDVDAHYIYITKSNVPDAILTMGFCGSYMMRVLSDQIGSVRRLWAVGSGGIAQDYGYDPFGGLGTFPSGSPVAPSTIFPFGFAGGLWDGDAQLYRFGARDYDPSTGRWVSKDPIRFGGGLNLYAYCDNDPVNCADPWGYDGIPTWLLNVVEASSGGEAGVLAGTGVGALGIVALLPVLLNPQGDNTAPQPGTPTPAPAITPTQPSAPPLVCGQAPYRVPPPPPRDCEAEYQVAISACDKLIWGKMLCYAEATQAYFDCISGN